MKIITEEQIEALGITPRQCVEWVEASFKSKPLADMPTKISVHPFEDRIALTPYGKGVSSSLLKKKISTNFEKLKTDSRLPDDAVERARGML